MERLTEKDGFGNYKVDGKNLDYHCTSKDKKGCITFRGQHIDKLAYYEDAEEQGLLLRLPCKIGDDVFISLDLDGKIYKGVCNGYTLSKHDDRGYLVEVIYSGGNKSWESFDSFGKTVFLTREEAEQALKQMGE